MYVLASQLTNLPVLSLQTGQAIATVVQPIVNQASLEIAALSCKLPGRQHSVILMRDIRQFASDCVIIDSFEDIEDANEIVRLRSVVEAGFNPVGKQVVTQSRQTLGKVEDYTINLETFMLQKLYVQQSLLKSVLFNNLAIDRTQIVEVTDKHFVVQDTLEKDPSLIAQPTVVK